MEFVTRCHNILFEISCGCEIKDYAAQATEKYFLIHPWYYMPQNII